MKIVTPETQTFFFIKNEPKYKPRAIWIKIEINKIDATFECNRRSVQPFVLSRITWIIERKDSLLEGINLIDKKIPERIWIEREMPNIKPRFHISLIWEGVGKSKRGFIKNFVNFIKTMIVGVDWDCNNFLLKEL